MTSSLLAAADLSDEETKSNEEGSGAPLFHRAPGLYHRSSRPNPGIRP
jgi:hypothetical protein